MKLPKKKSRKLSKIKDATVLAYGPEKIGKTTFWASCENAIFLKVEEGHKFVEVYGITINSWVDFKKAITLLSKDDDRSNQFTTIVIDTVEMLYEYCEDYVCSKLDIEHPSDLEWGKGWRALGVEWRKWIVRACGLGKGVVFISHSIEKEVKVRGSKITKIQPDIPKTGYKVINNLVDYILYYGWGTNEETGEEVRCVYTKPSEGLVAGDRGADTEIGLPDVMPMNYSDFDAALRGESIEDPLGTAEQEESEVEVPKKKRKKKKKK